MTLRTVSATPELVPFLLARMGPLRVDALQRLCDGRAEIGIAHNINASTLTWCGLDDQGVVTMGGILPMPMPGSGYVWQYIAGVTLHKRAYIEQGRTMLARGLDQYERLVSVIEPDYPAALRHIRRLGFVVSPPQEFNGHAGCLCERSR